MGQSRTAILYGLLPNDAAGLPDEAKRRNANVLTIEAPPLTEWSYDRPVVTRPRSKRGQRRAQERKWWDK